VGGAGAEAIGNDTTPKLNCRQQVRPINLLQAPTPTTATSTTLDNAGRLLRAIYRTWHCAMISQLHTT
jgi:hypothetical protein